MQSLTLCKPRISSVLFQRFKHGARTLHAMHVLDRVWSPTFFSSHRDIDVLTTNHSSIRLARLLKPLRYPHLATKVDRAELKRALENLVRPCSLLRFERKQRRERQEAAAAAAQRAECWKEDFMQKMEALDRSKAFNFLEVVSAELRQRRWQIRDIFRDVDRGKSGALSELSSREASWREIYRIHVALFGWRTFRFFTAAIMQELPRVLKPKHRPTAARSPLPILICLFHEKQLVFKFRACVDTTENELKLP